MKKESYHLTDHDFGKLSRTETNARARTRLLILHQCSMGKPAKDIATGLCIHYRTVLKTKHRYVARGIESIYDAKRKGRTSKLSQAHEEAFKNRIIAVQAQRAGGRLTADDIGDIAREEFDADYTRNGIYELLKRIGMSWISARSQHPKGDNDVQETFKKTSLI